MIDSQTGWFFVHASVKVIPVLGGKVLLGLNPRGDWELLGGWPDRGDLSLRETAQRELKEEANLETLPDTLVDAFLLRDPKVENPVAIIAYGVTVSLNEGIDTGESIEHEKLGLFGKDEISGLQNLLPEYKTVILKYLEMGGNNKS